MGRNGTSKMLKPLHSLVKYGIKDSRKLKELEVAMSGTHSLDKIWICSQSLVISSFLNGAFMPNVMSGPLDCQLSVMVPQKSFIRRHITINRDDFRSLLSKSGFPGVPTVAFRNNDVLAAGWYWRLLDFRRMGFGSLEVFLGQRRCFGFLINTSIKVVFNNFN
jgi:hypothetical protein